MSIKLKVLETLGRNPTLPYSIIAKEIGVTRERVRQIAHQNGYPSRKGITKECTCPVCGDIYHTRNMYCSRTCAYKAKRKRVFINCFNCGKQIERKPGTLHNQSGRYFCSRLCFFACWHKENPSIAS